MTRVVIAGAGFAGLGAALFIARRGHSVTLIDRDGPPPNGSPQDDVDHWRHPGAPQARQSHALLGRACRVLTDEAPDVIESLARRGVHQIPVAVGAGALEGEHMLLSRRPVAEAELRRIVAREPGVSLLSHEAVVGVRVSGGASPIVIGAELQSGTVVSADLVVDASGRRSALPDWFARAGLRAPIDEQQDCGFFYLSRFYRARPGCEVPTSTIPASVALDYATVLSLGGDNDTFSVTVTLSVDDPCRSALRRADRFEAFLREVPHAARWVQVGEPITDISMMSRIENRRRRLTDVDGPIAGGIVVLGDAALHTNPTLGRGVSMGLCHAQHLAEVVDGAADDPIGFAHNFSRWTDDSLGVWFDTQVAADATTIERLAAGLRGERLALPDHPAARFAAAAFAYAQRDEAVGQAVARLAHLFASPADAFGDPDVARRVTEFLATGPSLERPADSLTRADFEVLAAG